MSPDGGIVSPDGGIVSPSRRFDEPPRAGPVWGEGASRRAHLTRRLPVRAPIDGLFSDRPARDFPERADRPSAEHLQDDPLRWESVGLREPHQQVSIQNHRMVQE